MLPQLDITPNLVLVGALMPPLIAIITRQSWTSGLKQLVSLVVCLLAATLSAFVAGQLNVSNIASSAAVIVLVTEALYQKFYKPLTITDRIEQGINADPRPAVAAVILAGALLVSNIAWDVPQPAIAAVLDGSGDNPQMP